MTIDWFTVVAQALNFLILLWLMKRFLYKPILKAIDEREKLIGETLEKGEAAKTDAQKQKEEYDLKTRDLDRQRGDFLKQAQDEGNSEKKRLLQEARSEADEFSEKRRDSLIVEETALRKTVRDRMESEVLSVTRKILQDIAEASLEEQIVAVFTRRLRDMSASQKEAMVTALKKESTTVTIRTAFETSPELRSSIEAALKEILETQSKVAFESKSDLIGGIELVFDGHKIAWNIADYLSSLKEDFSDLIKANNQ